IVDDEDTVGQPLLPICNCSTSRTLCLFIQIMLEPPVSKTPRTPGGRFSPKLIYQAVAGGNKRKILSTYSRRPIDARQRLRTETEQIVNVDTYAFSGRLPAMADIIVSNDGGEIGQRTRIKGQQDCDQIESDQPSVATLQGDAGNDQHKPRCHQQHPDEG